MRYQDSMTTSLQSKFFTLLLSGLALIGMFLLLPHNAKADVIPGTGTAACATFSGFGCIDPNYAPVTGFPAGWQKTNMSGTSPGFLAAPAGPSGAFWIAPLGDVQWGADGEVFDIRTTFSTLTGGTITVAGTLAALGPVAVALDGFGTFAGPQSLTSLGSFSVTGGTGTTHTLDFIFTGCSFMPNCSTAAGNFFKHQAALLVDPSWSLAAPGATLDTIPESVLLAAGGVNPVPLPASVWLMLSGLVGVGVMARKRRGIAA